MKRLRDLDWPPEPDDDVFRDPLKRDDLKPLKVNEYEAIGMHLTFLAPVR